MQPEKPKIMFMSSDAAEQLTLSGWTSKGLNGEAKMFFREEKSARWHGCTHIKCECGNDTIKHYLKCEECRAKEARDNYMKKEYREWNHVEYVVEAFGDKFFWDIDSLEEYMHENEIESIDLLICQPLCYSQIDCETVASDAHEDWEPSTELEEKIAEFNEYLKTLKPHSWEPGKIRTSHSIALEKSE